MSARTRHAVVLLLGLVGTAEAASRSAEAQGGWPVAFDAPWNDVAPSVDEANGRVVAAAVGWPDERYGRLAVRRQAARRAGEARARAAIHRWADDALARAGATPATAAAVHRAIDEQARIVRVRPLADGGAVVEVAVSLEALRAAAGRSAPW